MLTTDVRSHRSAIILPHLGTNPQTVYCPCVDTHPSFDPFRLLRDKRIGELLQKVNKLMALIDDLQAQVATNTDAVQSAITLLGNLKAALDAAGTDPVKLQAIKDALSSSDTALASAITANTPAAPGA